MKRAPIIFALLLLAQAAFAQDYSTQSIGPFDYTYGPNGYQGQGQRLGQFYYYHDNRGNNITGQQIGPNGYYHNNRTPSYQQPHHYNQTPSYLYNDNDDE